METANTNNVAETPSQNDNPTIESLAQALVSAIVAKVQEGIEPSDHELVTEHVLDSEDFHHRVSELAYGQAEDVICDYDMSDKVEDCLEYRDWTDTVGELVDASVDQALSESEFPDKDYLAALETRVEERMERVESLLANLPCDLNDLALVEPRVSDLEHFERRTQERLGISGGPYWEESFECRIQAIERKLADLPGGLGELAKNERDVRERLEELEQFTASKFGQLDNIQIAFRGIVETMFAR